MKKAEMPDWVLKYQTEGTQIVKIGNEYYLYKVTSRWCPEKGRSQKITKKYLGKITPEGVIKPLKERMNESIKNIAVKEYGATQFIIENNKDIMEILKSIYSHTWKEIFVFFSISSTLLFTNKDSSGLLHNFLYFGNDKGCSFIPKKYR